MFEVAEVHDGSVIGLKARWFVIAFRLRKPGLGSRSELISVQIDKPFH